MHERLLATQEYFPVGQGLFASGAVGDLAAPEPQIRWVYDCGTVSKGDHVPLALSRLEDDARPAPGVRPKLDLVAISHFDTDHISGLASLIKRFRIETLMLPFTHLSQRLIAMFAARGYTRISAQGFFVDPVRTLSAIEGADIGRIILVAPAGPDAAAPFDPDGTPPGPPPQRRENDLPPWTLAVQEAAPADADEQSELDVATAGARPGTAVQMMRAGSAARYLDQWEFIPFNDPGQVKRVDATFLAAVNAKRTWLLAANNVVRRTRAVADLKKLYDSQFGDSARARNIISLFLYSGPVRKLSYSVDLGNAPPVMGDEGCGLWSCPACWSNRFDASSLDASTGRTGFLYCGDGYLDSPSRWQALQRFYGGARVDRLVSFQVMHHGAKANWHPGIAKAIRPSISVFSSDPGRGGTHHPHPLVAQDFRHYRPMGADLLKGVQTRTVYW